MANLEYLEKEAIESILGMKTGYVSDFSNRDFADFMFTTCKIQIYNQKYSVYGDSKSNRLRAFWDLEPDILVGKIIKKLIEREKGKNAEIINLNEYKLSVQVVNKLLGIKDNQIKDKTDEELFLEKEFKNLNIDKLKIESNLKPIVKNRLKEIQNNIKNQAYLSAIILMGSTLEGILLGLASSNPIQFNQANSTPKDKTTQKPLKFNEWTLSNLIDVSYETNFIGEDIKKFSHSLRDFRNYIHPYQQLYSNFFPDNDTVQICWKVLQAVINDLTK